MQQQDKPEDVMLLRTYLMAFLPQRQFADFVSAAGDLGARVDWNGITDYDSEQNQMAERGTSSYLFVFFFSAPVPIFLKHFFCYCFHIVFLLSFPYSGTFCAGLC
jgi:hypothetical protein